MILRYNGFSKELMTREYCAREVLSRSNNDTEKAAAVSAVLWRNPHERRNACVQRAAYRIGNESRKRGVDSANRGN